jgi:hypothetical protein
VQCGGVFIAGGGCDGVLEINVGISDLGAVLGESIGDSSTDSARGACDQGHSIL